MSELGQNLNELVIKGIDAIENTATSFASSTRNKVNEMSIRGRRSEILEKFGEKAYEAWLNGAVLPEELAENLREVLNLDAELNRIKAENGNQKEAGPSDCPAEAEELCKAEINAASEEACKSVETDIPVIETSGTEGGTNKKAPLSDAIDNLFSDAPQMNQMADKINNSLDEMGKQLLQFSSDFGKQLSDMADEIMNGSKKDDE